MSTLSFSLLFTEKLGNKAKVQDLDKHINLALITIDEAHLIYEWHSFRPLYAQCQELPSEFPNTPNNGTVTPDILVKLKGFLKSPEIEKVSVHHGNIHVP